MKTRNQLFALLGFLMLLFSLSNPFTTLACSTFKLQKGNELIYGHNLNQGDIGVPGMIFINKRGIFKKGRTWAELTKKDNTNPSIFAWISRYGSVTFNAFGRDFPDGGMNEVGLYIWEMNENADYPKNVSLPKLDQMNWMQYILDNCSTLDEAIQCAFDFEIDGWGWHYFIGDAEGNCAAVAFIDQKVKVNKNDMMPVPGLFNTPYDREMEFLKYYKGFGGLYEPDLNDSDVPRFVKTAVMVRDYDPIENAVDYGFEMLNKLKVNDEPEWSILFDARRNNIYFKTRINPEIKYLSMEKIDFSNQDPVMILNMDIQIGGDIFDQFQPYANEKMKDFIKKNILPILPEEFFTGGGLSLEECIQRISTHTDDATKAENQFFKGTWISQSDDPEDETKLVLNTIQDAVSGIVSNSKSESYAIDHLQMIDSKLLFTFKTKGNSLMEVQATIHENKINMFLYGTEDNYGNYILEKLN